ncbi:Predicted arabinose efflux permease, MFS family [Spirosomataceae bacterium TFI 002]|nr:Predicted arabinose efflux permease, MFS family [Spirosomataceae bacterium TFI 002]
MTNSPKILSKHFLLMCLSSFLFFSSFNMLIPELPDFLTSLGGAEYKGWIIGIFTITAGLSRPFSGRLTDRWGRIPVMILGAMVCVICGFIYPLVLTTFWFLALRMFHGFSTGFKPTGTAAYIADIVPSDKRGEAMGIYGFVTSTGMALGPFIGSLLAQYTSLNTLFYTSSAFSFLSVAILYKMEETLPVEQREKLSFKMLKIRFQDIFDKDVLPVTVVVFCTSFSFGTVLTVAPDLSKLVGFENKGIYFLIFTLSSLFTRIIAGKISDKKGRIPTLIVGSVLLIFSLLATSITTSSLAFIIGGILFGFAWGIISPSYQAWTVDLSKVKNRGRAIATMYIALEAGIGCGAVLPMFLYQNKAEQLPWAFYSGIAIAGIGLIYLLTKRKMS